MTKKKPPQWAQDRLWWDQSCPCADLVRMARATFNQVLTYSGILSTANSCVFASHYLAGLGRRFFPEIQFELEGGGLDVGGGILVAAGKTESHMWVKARQNNQSWILDITADQFGYPPLVAVDCRALEGIYTPDNARSLALSLERAQDTEPLLRALITPLAATNPNGI